MHCNENPTNEKCKKIVNSRTIIPIQNGFHDKPIIPTFPIAAKTSATPKQEILKVFKKFEIKIK